MIDVTDNAAIYARIDELREAKGWTIYELAKQASVSQTAIRHWRDGEATPSLVLLEAICSAFRITLIDFLADDKDAKTVLNAEQRELVDLWNGLSPEQRSSILNLMRSFKATQR